MYAGASESPNHNHDIVTESFNDDDKESLERSTKKKKKNKDSIQRSIAENFLLRDYFFYVLFSIRRYNLPVPQVIRMDNHLFERFDVLPRH